MHRTQIMLEEHQYHALVEEARRENKSMGALVRDLLNQGLQRIRKDSREWTLREARGMFSAPRSEGRNHDDYLYGDG